MGIAILKRQKFGWEIAITLVIKIAAICLLWWMFFSDPVDEDLTGPSVGNFLFGTVGDDPAAKANQSLTPKEK